MPLTDKMKPVSGAAPPDTLRETVGGLSDNANKAFKGASYASLVLKGDVQGLAEKAALDSVQSEKFPGMAEKGIEKLAGIKSVSPSTIESFGKAAKGLLNAIPVVSVAVKAMSAKEIADKVDNKFREGNYVGGCVELGSQLSQTFLGTAAGSAVSEGIAYVAGKVDPRYVPEKSGGRDTIENLIDGGSRLYAALQEKTSAPPIQITSIKPPPPAA